MKFISFFFLLVIPFLGEGCAPAPDESGKTVLKVVTWDNPRMMPVIENLARDYEKGHPYILVRIRQIPYREYLDRLTAPQPVSLLPDVLLVSTSQVAELYARGMLQSIKNIEPYTTKPRPAGYDPDLAAYFSFKNQLFALPRDRAPVCLIYYNKGLFDKAHLPYPSADWNWDQFLRIAKALTETQDLKNQKRVWGFVEDWPMVEPWVYGAGSGWVDRELNPAKFRVGEKGFLDGIRFRDRLIRREKVLPSPQDIVGEGQIGGADLFLNSQAAMILSGPWKGVEFNDQPRLKWGVAAIPVGPSGSRAFQTGGAGWGLSPSSSHPREAWDLLRFLSDASAEEKYARVGLALPALREVEAGTGYANSALEEAARALSAGRAVEDPRACNWPDVRENQINPILERVWDGELTPEKAAKTLNQGLAGNPLNMKPPERKPPAQNKPQMFLF